MARLRNFLFDFNCLVSLFFVRCVYRSDGLCVGRSIGLVSVLWSWHFRLVVAQRQSPTVSGFCTNSYPKSFARRCRFFTYRSQ